MRTRASTVVAAMVLGLWAVPAAPAAAAQCAVQPSDFNGDGRSDLAVIGGWNSELPGTLLRIEYGSPQGLGKGVPGRTITPQSVPVAPGAQVPQFGRNIQAGAFDADCDADLAVRAEGDRVLVLHGSPQGLTTTNAQWFTAAQVVPAGHDGRDLGGDLTAGDFDGDGRDDLAMGAWSSSDAGHPSGTGVGGVAVLYGTPTGLSLDRRGWFVRHSPGVPAPPTTGYQFFGQQLAAGDLTGDGRDDLVVSDDGADHHGGIVVLRGSAAGLTTTGAQWWDQNSPQVPESNDPGDQFGSELAVADFDADGRDDVAIGNANEWLGQLMDAGTVTVLRGAPGGLTASGAQLWSRATAGVPRDVAERAHFALSLAAGDLNGDGRPDLAIGADAMPLISGGVWSLGKGSVTVLYAGGSGLSAAAVTILDQASPGVPGAPEVGDRWSHDLRYLPAETGRPAALAVSAPGERIGTEDPEAGAVTVLPASPHGLTGEGAVLFKGSDVPAMAGRQFGISLG